MNDFSRLDGWIAWFARNPVAANLLMITLLVVGWWTFTDMRTEGFPRLAPDTVDVEITYNGGSPELVEEGAAVRHKKNYYDHYK